MTACGARISDRRDSINGRSEGPSGAHLHKSLNERFPIALGRRGTQASVAKAAVREADALSRKLMRSCGEGFRFYEPTVNERADSAREKRAVGNDAP